MKNDKTAYSLHNKVRLVQGGHEYFELLERMIDEAEYSIHLQMYIFEDDETGTGVANALIRAAGRKVKIYLLVDGYGSQDLPAAFIKSLTDAGIFFRRFQPLFKSRRFFMGRRLHHKVVVTDSWRSMVAGLNISNRYNDMPEARAWFDWALYVEGEAVAEIEAICKHRLRFRTKAVAPFKKHALPQAQVPVRVRVNDWFGRKQQVYTSYLQMFRKASSEIIIMSAYFLPGRMFRKNIAIAAARGVRVKVVLTGIADVFMIKYAERFIYRWLFKNRIEVYEYQKDILHSKIAVCDGEWMTIGSFNINNLSAFASIELNLDVDHAPFVQTVKQKLEYIITNNCVRIREEKFNQQFNWLAKSGHRIAYGIFRLLFFISNRKSE